MRIGTIRAAALLLGVALLPKVARAMPGAGTPDALPEGGVELVQGKRRAQRKAMHRARRGH